MAEKVIFEVRVKQDEEGCGIEFKHGARHFTVFGPDFSAWCRGAGVARAHRAWGPKWSHRDRDEARGHMRETLDFLEQMYDDLFDEEDRQDPRQD